MSEIHFLVSGFPNGQAIPATFTCDGANLSPSVEWGDMPGGTKSIALIVDDPDAPSGTFVHWVIYNLPPKRTGLPQGVAKTGEVAGGGMQGINDFRKTGYDGPCPPGGANHRYYFTLYALDIEQTLPAGYSKAQFLAAANGHILAQAQWMGTYRR